jgi:hypothetical protein
MWSSFKRKGIFLLAGAACSGMFTTAAHADVIWNPFVIRTVSGAATPVVPVGTSDGSSFTVTIDESGEKAGYGTVNFNGQSISSISSVSYDRIDTGSKSPYVNIWVTDGTNYAVIAPNVYSSYGAGGAPVSVDVNGLNIQSLGVNVYETNTASLGWLAPGAVYNPAFQGLATFSAGQYTPVTVGDLFDSLTIYGNTTLGGTGAPKAGTGFNLIFGDTQNNFTTGVPYVIGDVSVATTAAPVPLPAAAWAGMALFGGIGVSKLRRRSMNAA